MEVSGFIIGITETVSTFLSISCCGGLIIVGLLFFIIDKMCPWTDEERRTVDKLNSLIWSSRSDELLSERLMSDPLAVLDEHGVDVPIGVTVTVTVNSGGSGGIALIKFSHPDPQSIETVLLGTWDGT